VLSRHNAANQAYIKNQSMVATEMFTFLQKFFQTYPQFAKSKFFITGTMNPTTRPVLVVVVVPTLTLCSSLLPLHQVRAMLATTFPRSPPTSWR